MTYLELEAGLRGIAMKMKAEAYARRGQPDALFIRENLMRDALVLGGAADVVHECAEGAPENHV